MSDTAARDDGYSVERYFALVDGGILQEDDRVELLEGLVVASPSQGPLHSAVIMDVEEALRRSIGDRAAVRVQMPLLASERSAPEPDIALVKGTARDYRDRHPDAALLVVEVSEHSLPQDRLTKSRIYAGASVPEYWIVNLRERCVEVLTAPDAALRVYGATRRVEAGEYIELAALPGARVAANDLLPAY